MIGWASDTDGTVLVKTAEGRSIMPKFDVTEGMYRKIRCPVLAIHGDNDQIQPYARGKLVAELIAGSELETIPGGGHNPLRYALSVLSAKKSFRAELPRDASAGPLRGGRCMAFATATPETIAEAMIAELRTAAQFKPVEAHGAERAARMLAELL